MLYYFHLDDAYCPVCRFYYVVQNEQLLTSLFSAKFLCLNYLSRGVYISEQFVCVNLYEYVSIKTIVTSNYSKQALMNNGPPGYCLKKSKKKKYLKNKRPRSVLRIKPLVAMYR